MSSPRESTDPPPLRGRACAGRGGRGVLRLEYATGSFIMETEVVDRIEPGMNPWEIGELLMEARANSSDIRKVADKIGKSSKTVESYEYVAREWRDSHVDRRHSWSVYKILTGITDPSDRYDVLASKEDWTTAEAREAVQAYHAKQRGEEVRSKRTIPFMGMDISLTQRGNMLGIEVPDFFSRSKDVELVEAKEVDGRLHIWCEVKD